MLQKRVFSALIAIPLLIILIKYAPIVYFYMVLSLFIITGLNEYSTMLAAKKIDVPRLTILILGWLLSLFIYLIGEAGVNFFITIFLIISLILALIKKEDITAFVQRLSIIVFGIFYVSLLMSYLLLIRKLENGANLIFFLLFIIWAGDTAAYYIGTKWGKHKLYPQISPKKSVEGSIAGLIGGIIAAFLAKWWFLGSISSIDCLILGLSISILGQLGDLAESMIKRSCGVKDSGKIIPGHGGVLDRLDSLLFSAPLLYYYMKILFNCG